MKVYHNICRYTINSVLLLQFPLLSSLPLSPSETCRWDSVFGRES